MRKNYKEMGMLKFIITSLENLNLKLLILKEVKITLFSLNDFFETTVNYLAKNPYAWTRKILK